MIPPHAVHDLRASKGRKKWLQLHVDTPAEGAAAVEAGITLLSCELDHHLEEMRRWAPSAFLSACMPHGAVSSPSEAVRLGGESYRVRFIDGAGDDQDAIEVGYRRKYSTSPPRNVDRARRLPGHASGGATVKSTTRTAQPITVTPVMGSRFSLLFAFATWWAIPVSNR